MIYGNIANKGFTPTTAQRLCCKVPILVDNSGLQPNVVKDIPPQLIALMRTNINVQELTVAALVNENREHIYHAAMLDPHTEAELDLDQIWNLTQDLLAAHDDWLPAWARVQARKAG
ncbi:hypothetical protein [Cypionkella sp. TWP1-2-1b2]|uniref:family 4 glycosyl hydrolase n=1 Tax=Cypionkella sp. TWP1-2-1b2 TaxID=2804675 RepID=UPI003CEFCA9F